jgi:hypothetical protein
MPTKRVAPKSAQEQPKRVVTKAQKQPVSSSKSKKPQPETLTPPKTRKKAAAPGMISLNQQTLVAFGGGTFVYDESDDHTRFLKRADLKSALSPFAKVQAGHPTTRTDIVIMGDLERLHSIKVPKGHYSGSQADIALAAVIEAQNDQSASGPRKTVEIVTLAEFLRRVPPEVEASVRHWTRFSRWTKPHKHWKAPGRARNESCVRSS